MIFVVGLPAAQALKSAKVQQPVIFGGPPDPVSAGLVPSIANHGTNFTGTRYLPPAERILDVFEQAYPTAKRVAVLHNPGEANSMSVVRVFLDGAQKRQLISLDLGATNALEIESALRALADANVDGLFLPTDNLVYSSLDRILSQTKALGIPVFNCTKLSVEKGATFSLATDYFKVGSITAEKIAAQILFFGKKPNQLDVIEIEEGNIYVNSNIESSTRIKPIAGYEIVSVQ
jgi:putative tryptophan/tyrosine transport system substrate-binding protein